MTDHPTPHQNGHVTSGYGTTDRQPAKKPPRTKSSGKRSKEKVRVPRETGPAIQQYQDPVHVSVSREAGASVQQHEDPTQIYDASVHQNAAWPEDQQAPQQDKAVQPAEQQSLHQQQHQSQNTIQPGEENRWQDQGEERLGKYHRHGQQNATKPVDESQWQLQNEAKLDENYWQEQQGVMQTANEHTLQRQAEVFSPDDQQWQEQQMFSNPNDVRQAWQEEQQLRTNDGAKLHQPDMIEALHDAGNSPGEVQAHSRLAQLQQSGVQKSNDLAITVHNIVDNNVHQIQHPSNSSFHPNSVQPMPIATGIKGVMKKKKKKKKTKGKPALDVRTLPEVPLDIPFEQLGQVRSAESHRDPYPDQQPGSILQPYDNRVHNGVYRVSRTTPDLGDQHDLRPAVEAMEVDQQNQVHDPHHASPYIVDNEPTNLPFASRSSGPEQASHLGQSNRESPRQEPPRVAAPPGETTEHEAHIHQERRYQECTTDGYHQGPQHDAQHRLQATPASINDQVAVDANAQRLPRHTNDVSEHCGGPQYRVLRHAHAEEFLHTNEPVVQDIIPKQNRQWQHSSKCWTPHQVVPDELTQTDEHVRRNFHAQQTPLEQTTEGSEHRTIEATQHHAPVRPQPLQFLTPPDDCTQQSIKKPEQQDQLPTQVIPSQSLQPNPMVINAQPATERQSASAVVGRTKLDPRRSLRQQNIAPGAQLILPVVDVPTTKQISSATKETQSDFSTDACSDQDDPVSGAFKVLQLTLRQDLQATIAKENEARRTLQSEIAKLKVSEARLQAEVNIVTASKIELIEVSSKDREKLKANSERLTKLQKFIGGINNDLAKEKQNAKALYQRITELANEGKANAIERQQIHKQLIKAVETSRSVQGKWAKELTDAKLLIQKLELEKTSLEKDLRGNNQLLEDERDQRLRLSDDIRLQAVDQQLMKQLINDTSASLLQKLSELQSSVTNSKDTVASQGVTELLQSVKSLESRNTVCPADLAGLKEQIDTCQNR